MHVGAAEAISVLNKTKWANTDASDRLRILEKIQGKLFEEMEDLGVEEAEMKNMNVGTSDNLFAGDACRLTAVVPVAFAISSVIALYKTNLAGKNILPLKVTKVEENGGVDMIDFGAATPDISQTTDEKLQDTPEAKTENGGNHAIEENGDKPENASPEPAVESPSQPEKSTVEPETAVDPPFPAAEPPSEPPADPPVELPSELPSEPPAEPPSEPISVQIPTTDVTSDEPSDPMPEIPSSPPPCPPSDPPPPPPGDDDQDDMKIAHNENGEVTKRESMDVTETSQVTEGQLSTVDIDASETAADKEIPTNGTLVADEKIKIEFDPDDEFANLDPDAPDPTDLLVHDILVSPRTWNERGYFNSRQERLRVKGDPNRRVGPYDRRDPQATAILGASCYSAAAEIIKATFLDGHVVVFKPHPHNAEVDKVWAEIMKPLSEVGAVSFCHADEGPELVQDPRIDQIYMTGSKETVQEIRKLSNKPCILQTGSVNPVILVPGLDRPWKPKEMRHHVLQIVTAAKFNGGHFCGRPQVIITSKTWDQRDEFLLELENAIAELTPPEASYDPKYRKEFEKFTYQYPNGRIIPAKNLDTNSARMLLVKGASQTSYGLLNEAFCQVLIEVPLDLPDHPVAFLPDAVKFCNEKLFGSLCATIVIDDVTNKQYNGIVQQALTDLRYGTVSTNAMACLGWFNPSLYWGSYQESEEDARAQGVGHFGNLLGYEKAVKSIISDTFCGHGHFIKTCRGAYAEKIASLSHYALDPSLKKVTAYKVKGVRAASARKDW